MTKNEAIYTLKNTAWLGWDEQKEKVTEAVRMAVEALKRETSGDAISKQGAIDICNIVIDLWQGQLGEGALVAIKNAINNLPSVQPEDCDTCKHGYFGDDQCERCRVRYPSHYERRTDGH